jgi:hypothetical protein
LLPDSSYTPVFLFRSYTELYEEYEVAGVCNGVELDRTVERSDKSSGSVCVPWSCGVSSAILDRRDEESAGSGPLREENGNRMIQHQLWNNGEIDFWYCAGSGVRRYFGGGVSV